MLCASNPRYPKKSYGPDIVRESAPFTSYYREVGIVPEEEWTSFIEHMQKPLPVTFRINELVHYSFVLTSFSLQSKRMADSPRRFHPTLRKENG